MRCRIDFKYALGLELDDPGFHHSVLSDFRDRLRTTQRTDSTHVLGAVRDLTRLELVTEAVRAALEELVRAEYLVQSSDRRG